MVSVDNSGLQENIQPRSADLLTYDNSTINNVLKIIIPILMMTTFIIIIINIVTIS